MMTTHKQTLHLKKTSIFVLDHAIEVILVLLLLALTIGVPNFMTWGNWMNIFRANSLKGVIAFGMTMAIIAGLIDLDGRLIRRDCRPFVSRFVSHRPGYQSRLHPRHWRRLAGRRGDWLAAWNFSA